MKTLLLMGLFLGFSAFAKERLFLGSMDVVKAPHQVELVKTKDHQVQVVVTGYSYFFMDGDEDNDILRLEKTIPQLTLSGRYNVYYNNEWVGRVRRMFKGSYYKKSMLAIESIREEYCSRYINGDDCVETDVRYNIYLTLQNI